MAWAPMTISLTPDFREKLLAESKETDRPASAIIRRALSAYWAAQDK